MTKDETRKLVAKLAGLFPDQLTEEQIRYYAESLLAFDVGPVDRAIRHHRDNHEFLSWPKLREGIEAETHTRRMSPAPQPEGRWVDVYRRQRPDLTTASDAEVVMYVHRGWWERSPQSAGYRVHIIRSCASRLVACGIPRDDAALAADTATADKETFIRAVQDLVENLALAAGAA
jgi:hypothetical protein